MKRLNEMALRPLRTWWRWAGGHATPAQPWLVRKAELMRLADKGFLQTRNARRSRSPAMDRQWNRDIERLIAEGVLRRHRSPVGHGMGRTYVRLVSPLPEPEETEPRVPYAKRKAGIAEFNAANGMKEPT